MLEIDGAYGEGGGQILRTALTMAMVTGTDIKIDNIRAGRAKPGLMRQHLACVKAAQAVSNAEVTGDEVGSLSVTFKPKNIKAGDYEFAVGTAGSTMLIFQTVLPALLTADAVSRLKFVGGTHNMLAPSFDFIKLSFMPVLKKMGVEVEMELLRYGFYPQGGGEWQAVIKPVTRLKPFDLSSAGELIEKSCVVTNANVPEHVAERELAEVMKHEQWQQEELRSQTVDTFGGGNVVSLRMQHQHCTEVIEMFGKVGVSAESIAKQAIKKWWRYQASDAAVGIHLADQLLLPMAIAGEGVFTTMTPCSHTETNRHVIEKFIDKRFQFKELAADLWQIRL